VNYAMNRAASIQSVRHGGAVPGAAMMPPPFGTWGLPEKELKVLPGYREPEKDRAEARKLLASAGYGPGANKQLRVEMVTRTLPTYVDLASYVVDQLKQVGVEVTVKQLDTAQWFPALARKEFLIAANLTAPGADDPDVMFYENFKCGTARNYSDYCDEQVDKMIDAQSSELDRAKRLKMVWDIQKRLEADVARPMLGWRKEYFVNWPYVKGLIAHHSLYNWHRQQDTWLDR
jgi:peptide/nickel transport system substrate-binding protein